MTTANPRQQPRPVYAVQVEEGEEGEQMEGGEEPGSMLDVDEPRPEARPELTVVRVAPQVVAGVSSSLVAASEAREEPVIVGRVKPPKRKRAPVRCTVCDTSSGRMRMATKVSGSPLSRVTDLAGPQVKWRTTIQPWSPQVNRCVTRAHCLQSNGKQDTQKSGTPDRNRGLDGA